MQHNNLYLIQPQNPPDYGFASVGKRVGSSRWLQHGEKFTIVQLHIPPELERYKADCKVLVLVEDPSASPTSGNEPDSKNLIAMHFSARVQIYSLAHIFTCWNFN